MARPTSFRPEFVEQSKKLAKMGATDMELSGFFEVSVSTINLWKIVHPEFSESLKMGKDEADARVERSLYQRAMGYEQDAVKIFMPAGAAAPVYAPYIERIPPDTTACIFWLKNRRREEWRDKPAGSEDSIDRLDEIVAAMKAGPVERGGVNE